MRGENTRPERATGGPLEPRRTAGSPFAGPRYDPPYEVEPEAPNDYLLELETQRAPTPFGTRLLRFLLALVLLALAAISFGVFWVVGKMLDLF